MTSETFSYKDTHTVFQSSFGSLSELIDYLENTPPNKKIFDQLSSEEGTFAFTRTKSLMEAFRLCREGYNEGFDNFLDLKEELNTHMPAVAYRRYPQTDIAGYAPNVGAFLSGSPKSMYRLAPQEENKFVTIYFNCSYTSKTKYPQIQNKGIITLELIQLLESVGYRVDLRFFELSNSYSEIVFFNIRLKDAGENIDIKSCYFPMCHPSFLRRVMFRLLEVHQNISKSWSIGYGNPLPYSEINEFIENIAGRQDYILINTPGDMGVAGHNIIYDADNLLQKINIQDYVHAGKGDLLYDEKSNIKAFQP